jgi:cell division protein FtsZ
LYEVDEAATRIREEVDKDANIIVGATFDESLDGLVRVSVVATGIDKIPSAKPVTPAVETPRAAVRSPERVERAPQTAAPSRIPAGAAAAIEQAATAAVAAAILPPTAIEDVTIRSMPPKPSLFMDPRPEPAPAPETEEQQGDFIPPRAERMPRQARMPRIEDLPMPAQRQIRAQRGELDDSHHPEKQRVGLLQRLASVGLGRREEPEHEPESAQPSFRPMPPLPERPAPRQQEKPVSDFAPRRAPQGLDQHGRQAPVQNPAEDDQLDIPAFLRRQAN